MTPDQLSAALSKHYVLSAAEWRQMGASDRHMRTLVRHGGLVRLRHGVYATATAVSWGAKAPAYQQALLVQAARVATGRDAVGSHESAALMHGIDVFGKPQGGPVTITRPAGSRALRADPKGVAVHSAEVPQAHVTKRYGVMVTTAARTVIDLARSNLFMSGVAVADSALHRSETSKAELEQVLEVCSRWPGADQARRAVAFADSRAESVLESCARVVFAEYGLPAPELQVELGGDGFAGRVDFYWPQYRTVAEADGKLKYEEKGRAVAQLRRDQALRAAGFRVVHFGLFELFQKQAWLIAAIQAAFRGEIG